MKILVILGHPSTKSFNAALADTYESQARKLGHDVKRINLSDLEFDPVLHEGYSKIQELEPDLIKAQENIKWAEHIVIVSPVWWGGVPALLKGFIDRTILPKFGFKLRKESFLWDRLLKGRSGHIIRTTDTPRLWSKLVILDPDIRVLKHATMHFCGIRPVKVTSINSLRNSTEEKRQKAIQKVTRSVPTL